MTETAHAREKKDWWRSETYAFLKEFKCTKGSTHTSMIGGSYAVPADQIDILHEKICTDLNASRILHLTERLHEPFNFFMDVDLDFWTTCAPPDTQVLKSAVARVTQAPGTLISTRTPWKIHVHCPGLRVSSKQALTFVNKISTILSKELASTDWKNAIDRSVYKSGLRMLGHCKPLGKDKPTGKGQPRQFEVDPKHAEYIAKDAMKVTGLKWDELPRAYSLGQPVTPKLLRQLSILTFEKNDVETAKPPQNGKGKGKAILSRSDSDVTVLDVNDESASSSEQPILGEVLSNFIANTFNIDRALIDKGRRRGETVIISTHCRLCPYSKREHHGNQLYVVLSTKGMELRCHDADCKQPRKVMKTKFENLPQQLSDDIERALGLLLDTAGLEEIKRSVRGLKNIYPTMNLEELGTPKRSRLDSAGVGYLTPLTGNHYCPICKREHDSALNCVLTTQKLQKIICKQSLDMLEFPMSSKQCSLIFAQIGNLNVSVNLGNVDNTLRDFGDYDDFPSIHIVEALNKLCFASLCGRTREVARYVYALMEGEYAFQDGVWYWFNGKLWQDGVPPDDLINDRVIDTYMTLLKHYTSDEQQGWLKSQINEMGAINRRKVYIEDLERHCVKTRKCISFNADPHLIGFENVVFDSRDGSTRQHRADDYLTEVLSYDLPDSVDAKVRGEIEKFIADIMPDPEVRAFLLVTLALHLEGLNRHSLAMVWSGTGGNGKSVLKSLMKLAFGDLHHEPAATFLTAERPSADKPSADLYSLALARGVFCSEPEHGKRTNSGFLKFITGKDEVKTRNPHEKQFHKYVPRFLVILLCNAIPLFQGGDQEVRGLWRRLVIISFETEFVKDPILPHQRACDLQLEERIESWGPQFMLLLTDVYRTYLRNNRALTIPTKVQRNLEEQKAENDPFPKWFVENLVVEPDAKMHIHQITDRFNESGLLGHNEKGGKVMYDTRMIKKKLITMKVSLKTTEKGERISSCYCGQPNIAVSGYSFVSSER